MADARYPEHPGLKGPSDTGPAAAASFAPKAKTIRERTLLELERGPATAEQVAERLGLHFMIVRARCSELRALGLVADSGERGAGALGGRVIVWRATTAAEREAFSRVEAK
ncbi:hypothetical protein [Phenylobacterium montanum]|uniref:Helix-turn-helix type 11 domain-containing protein n=1 Tax=Phenylobacterium montanum TaxID=2823693 RepID=A0A975ITY4_9CAUL|nr:hypothetical protein [Caulobacter sp. S6]QUD86954.1 hypothetical protein KCG34_18025 [Caulobacter sp. S6]